MPINLNITYDINTLNDPVNTHLFHNKTHRVGETSNDISLEVSSFHTTQRTPYVLGVFINFEQ